jgi:hypothetical protein
MFEKLHKIELLYDTNNTEYYEFSYTSALAGFINLKNAYKIYKVEKIYSFDMNEKQVSDAITKGYNLGTSVRACHHSKAVVKDIVYFVENYHFVTRNIATALMDNIYANKRKEYNEYIHVTYDVDISGLPIDMVKDLLGTDLLNTMEKHKI